MCTIRVRSIIDNRHEIRDPYGNKSSQDMEIWKNTLLKTRIPTLFSSVQGLSGHAEQIQNELNRIGKVEGLSGDKVDQAKKTLESLREALTKAKAEAEKNRFPFHLHWQDEDYFSAA